MLSSKMIKFYLILSFISLNCAVSVKYKPECGYKQCPQTRSGALNVHIISHSHMDAGWVKTFDQYYHGTKTSISSANVQLIYHSVLSELLHDKRRKFTFSETSYFWRWWKEQRPATRSTFRALVQEGRIEFAGGGWVQNDEATADYLQIIDQFTWGLRKLNDTLGPCGKPKAGWQIDTYGHSREQASLLAQMGFDGMFIGRVEFKEREAMIEEDRMEFMWRGSDVLGKMSDIMTHTTFNLYNAPEGFCFDYLCTDEPVIDDPDNLEGNADKRVSDFIGQIERQAKYYDHDNVMVTMGGDFTYQGAASWFMNIDKIINFVNNHPANFSDVNIFYSTPSCYLKAIYLHGRRDKALYTEKNDYLPYGSDSSTFWTGFYTSRPSFKYFIRRANHFLQVFKQLSVISRAGDSYELHLLRHAVSLVAHHDAMTGTSQQHVINDFVKQLNDAVELSTRKLSVIINNLTPSWAGRRSKNNQQFVICHQLNISQCQFTETQESMILMVYNPSSVKTYHYVRIPAIALHYTVKDFNDEDVEYQLVPLQAAVLNLPGRSSSSIQELWFEAENIPPLGYSAFYITPVRDQLEEGEFAKKANSKVDVLEVVPSISNEYLKVVVDKATGLLSSVQHVDGWAIQVSQNFHYYSQLQQNLQSGAYAFRPGTDKPTVMSTKATYHTVRGTLVKEIKQKFNDWTSQTIRLYRGEEFVEFEWTIGPIPVGSDLGKEVVSIFSTNISTNSVFYTDSNGRQMMKRTCWNETTSHPAKKPLSSCYYPVTSRACLSSHNSSSEICVLVDRPQGATSYRDGDIELMVHRKLLTDDGFGLEESLNEEEFGVGMVVRGKHRLVLGNSKDSDGLSFSERAGALARRWSREPLLLFTAGDKISRRKWLNVRNKRFSLLKLHGLPRHVHILTLEPWKAGSVLLRLENTLEKPKTGLRSKVGELEDLQSGASHIAVDLRKVFMMRLRAVRETTLAANQWLEDARQMDWSSRYVYQGSDDGLLPDDVFEHDDETKPKETENYDLDISKARVKRHFLEPNSEEETESLRQTKDKRHQKPKTKLRPREVFNRSEFDRKKRYANESDIAIENKYIPYKDVFNKTGKEGIVNESEVLDSDRLKKDEEDRTIKDNNKPLYNVSVPNNGVFTFINDWSTMQEPRRPYTDKIAAEHSEETTEDHAASVRRKMIRGSRVVGRDNVRDMKRDDRDDPTQNPDMEVTKSIYEMYYRKLPKNPFRTAAKPGEHPGSVREGQSYPKHRRERDDFEEYEEDSYERPKRRFKKNRIYKNTEDSEEYGESNRRDGAHNERPNTRTPNPERRGMRREYRQPDDDYPRDKKSDYVEDRDTERDKEYWEGRVESRNKRDLQKDDDPLKEEDARPASAGATTKDRPDSADMEYVITLRPTQIRTFVVWFEPSKRG